MERTFGRVAGLVVLGEVVEVHVLHPGHPLLVLAVIRRLGPLHGEHVFVWCYGNRWVEVAFPVNLGGCPDTASLYHDLGGHPAWLHPGKDPEKTGTKKAIGADDQYVMRLHVSDGAGGEEEEATVLRRHQGAGGPGGSNSSHRLIGSSAWRSTTFLMQKLETAHT